MEGRNLSDTISAKHEGTALIDLSKGGRTYSFSELNNEINALAASIDVQRGQRIGLLAANSAAFIKVMFAIMRAGGVAVPMNTRFPERTLAHICSDSELARVYVDAEQRGRLPETMREDDIAIGNDPGEAGFSSVVPAIDEAGLILYTSGSTGVPKGVELSHESQWVMAERMAAALKGVTAIVAAPLYHMNGTLFFMSLAAGGGTVVLMPRFDARAYLQAIHDHKVQVITGVPTMLSLMLKEQDLVENLNLSSVLGIQVGSAPLSETLIAQVEEVFPNARISNGYGTTEAGAGMFGAHPDGIPTPSLSIGYPQEHVKIRLVDGADENEGVLQVITPAAMNGYLNLPEKTAEKMSDDGWVDTGDIMRRDEQGFFYFVGRDDDMFNCGGENVYPGEVERILETDPRVAECCVVPIPDEVKAFKPVAFVVTAVGTTLNEDEVKAIALADAPAYMHPRRVYFLETMPLAGTNKIDRASLTRLATERAAADSN